jgi:hypothetical protein
MLGEITWLYPGRVVFVEYVSVITPGDVTEADRRLSELILASGHPPVHVVADVTHRTGFDPQMMQLKRHLWPKGSTPTGKSHVDWTVVIEPNPQPVVKFVVTVMCQLTGRRLAVFPTREAALDFLLRQDDTLPRDLIGRILSATV